MQLVATAKMKRAQNRSNSAASYAEWALDILSKISSSREVKEHPYWNKPAVNSKVAILLVTSDKGFCGGMNMALISETLKLIKRLKAENTDAEIIAIGKKGRDFIKRTGRDVSADFSGLGDKLMLKDIFGISHLVIDDYLTGKYDKIYVAFTQFINTLSQNPVIQQILPIDPTALREISELTENTETNAKADYILEPNLSAIVDKLVPHLIEVSIFKAFLENQASEHSARMVAMKNATERAGELIQDLKLEYNQARQAGITREIAEISSGAMATS